VKCGTFLLKPGHPHTETASKLTDFSRNTWQNIPLVNNGHHCDCECNGVASLGHCDGQTEASFLSNNTNVRGVNKESCHRTSSTEFGKHQYTSNEAVIRSAMMTDSADACMVVVGGGVEGGGRAKSSKQISLRCSLRTPSRCDKRGMLRLLLLVGVSGVVLITS
jgi:hypothetical protein